MQAIATEATQGMIGGLLWLALLHGLWIGLAAAGGVGLAFQGRAPLGHRARRAALLSALGLVAVGPPALSALQYLEDGRRAGRVTIGAGVVASVSTSGMERSPSAVSPVQTRLGEASPWERARRRLDLGLDGLVRIAHEARPFGLVVWSMTVAGLSAVLALGARGLSRLRREARPAPPLAQDRAQRLARLLRLRSVPAIRVHPTLAEPCLCGVFRPVVLLPGRWLASASVESLDAVLAHELAHAKRFDHLVNLAQRGIEVLLFFHPGVHWLSRSLRRQGEHCADALAVRLTGDPMALARTLESLARSRAGAPASRPIGAALGGETTSLLPRIQELIGMTPIRTRFQAWPVVALASALAFAFVAASVGFADDKPPEPSPQIVPAVEPQPPAAPRLADRGEIRQISYRVRFVDTPALPWLARLQDGLTPCEPAADARAWLLDDGARDELLKRLNADRATTVVQAPTVTTFEHDYGSIVLGLGSDRVEFYNPLEVELLEKHPKSITRDREWRPRVQLAGRCSAQGIQLSVDLRDSMLHELKDDRASAPKPETVGSAAEAREVHFKASCEVPTHSNLLISMGSRRRGVGSDSAPVERLIVVTPLRIVVDSKGVPRVDPPNPR